MNEYLKEFAENHNVNYDTLVSATSFLVNNIQKNDSLREEFMKNPVEVIEIGIKKWLEVSTEYHKEIIEGKSKRAKKFYEDVYQNLKS